MRTTNLLFVLLSLAAFAPSRSDATHLPSGQAAVVAAASAGERLEALESALPGTVAGLCALVEAHAAPRGPHAFAARQLLLLASSQDFGDESSRRDASALAARLLRSAPPSGAGYADGGAGDWEAAVVGFAVKAAGGGAAGAEAVLSAASDVRDAGEAAAAAAAALSAAAAASSAPPADVADASFESEGGAAAGAWVAALSLVAALLRGAPDAASAGAGSPSLAAARRDLTEAGAKHAASRVRRVAATCLGLASVAAPPSSGPEPGVVSLLRAMAEVDAHSVRMAAAAALCDLALLHGCGALDAATDSAASASSSDASNAWRPPQPPRLMDALLGWARDDEAATGLDVGAATPDEADAAASAGCEESELRSVAAEGIAKLLLSPAASVRACVPPAALATLILLGATADEAAHPRLTQALGVALPAVAEAAGKRWPDLHVALHAAAPLALRAAACAHPTSPAAARKAAAACAGVAAALLRAAAAEAEAAVGRVRDARGGADADAASRVDRGAEAGAEALLSAAVAAGAAFEGAPLLRAYTAGLAKCAAATRPRAPAVFPSFFSAPDVVAAGGGGEGGGDVSQRSAQARVVHRLRSLAAAAVASGAVADKAAAKELSRWADGLGELEGVDAGDAQPDDGLAFALAAHMAEFEAAAGSEALPFVRAATGWGGGAKRAPAKRRAAPAAARGKKAAAASEDDDEEEDSGGDTSSDGEDVEEPASPLQQERKPQPEARTPDAKLGGGGGGAEAARETLAEQKNVA